MAISYSTLFARLGRLVYWYNQVLSIQGTTLMGTNGMADDILDEFNDRRDLLKTAQSDVEGFASQAAGWCSQIKNYADAVLGDLQPELNASSTAPTTILPLLIAQMVADSETVDANTISDPVVTAGTNVGTGVLVASKLNGSGIDDERIISEEVLVTVTGDKYNGGGSSGGETFSVVGLPVNPATSYRDRGSGQTTMTVGDAQSVLGTAGTFATFTSNVPSGWTVVAGTAGTHIRQETTNIHRGTGALELDGDGSAATVTLKYTFAAGALRPKTLYCLSAWARKDGTVSAGSNLQIAITGTGVSASNAYNADPSGLTTSFAHKYVFFATPAAIPSDYAVTITWTAANTAGGSALLYIDNVSVVRPAALGNVSYAAFAGATDFVAGDSFSVTTASDGAGVIQSWFGRVYNVMLPSSGSPTISDSLAT